MHPDSTASLHLGGDSTPSRAFEPGLGLAGTIGCYFRRLVNRPFSWFGGRGTPP